MAVRCSKCGEELLGPVNRCWKCGQYFATLPDAGGLPPVRREAMPAATVSVAPMAAVPIPAAPASAPAENTNAAQATETPPVAVPATAGEPAAVEAPVASAPIRTGSPFAPGAAMTPVASHPTSAQFAARNRPKKPATDDLIRDHVAVAGAIASIVLGAFGLSVSWMSNPTAVIGGALIAMLGLVMGMWGLHSRRRGWALFGMLVCVAAISLASYSGAMLIYDARMAAEEAEGQVGTPGY